MGRDLMTEQQWLDSDNILKMSIAISKQKFPYKWSTRKARLFACACCRRIWTILTEPAERAAVEAAEQTADKQLTNKQLKLFHQATPLLLLDNDGDKGYSGWVSKPNWEFWAEFNQKGELFCSPGKRASSPSTWGNANGAANDARALLYYRKDKKKSDAEEKVQADLFRDIVGPLTLPVIKPAWLTAKEGLVVKLAQEIYDKRTFGQLPKLADTLGKVGCKDKELLEHLRSRKPHARGCWALDLLLGKK